MAYLPPRAPLSRGKRAAQPLAAPGPCGPLRGDGGAVRICLSDELRMPYSSGMLGSQSPYLLGRLANSCYKCGARQQHIVHECPKRSVRVRGQTPRDGYRMAPRTLLNGLAPSSQPLRARADYRRFLTEHPGPMSSNRSSATFATAGASVPRPMSAQWTVAEAASLGPAATHGIILSENGERRAPPERRQTPHRTAFDAVKAQALLAR